MHASIGLQGYEVYLKYGYHTVFSVRVVGYCWVQLNH